MCVNIEVILPTIETFLLLYSLRSGSIVILVWTLLRSLFCVIFFTTALLEVFVHRSSPFGAWLVNTEYQPPENITLILFYSYVSLIICEAILAAFTNFLGYGIYFEKSNLLKHYLICRFLTWIVEVLIITVLCLSHKLLIGYYLSILLFVILEFYSFIVVYSYFVTISEFQRDIMACKSGLPCDTMELQE